MLIEGLLGGKVNDARLPVSALDRLMATGRGDISADEIKEAVGRDAFKTYVLGPTIYTCMGILCLKLGQDISDWTRGKTKAAPTDGIDPTTTMTEYRALNALMYGPHGESAVVIVPYEGMGVWIMAQVYPPR